MSKLNSTQVKLLQLLQDHGSSYTLEELAGMLDLSHKSSVHYNLKKMVQMGYLKTNPNNPSDYIILDKMDQGLAYLPLYSGAKCGPNGSLISNYATRSIPVPSQILNFDVTNALAIITEGKSMEHKIPEGSIVIVNRNESEYVPNATFLVAYDNKPIVKNLYKDNKKSCFIMSSFNPDFLPFIADMKDVSIIGRVRAVINNF